MSHPKVSVTAADGTVIYSQILDDSKSINKLIALGMESPAGKNFVLTIENNGHKMEFPSVKIELDPIVRVANGILMREKKEVVATA